MGLLAWHVCWCQPAATTMVLIRGGEVYSPAPLGRREVLVSGTTIVALLDPSDSLVASLASSDRCVLVAACGLVCGSASLCACVCGGAARALTVARAQCPCAGRDWQGGCTRLRGHTRARHRRRWRARATKPDTESQVWKPNWWRVRGLTAVTHCGPCRWQGFRNVDIWPHNGSGDSGY